MAEKISVTIALEGGKEVQRQLADIGEAGQKAFADIAKEAEKAGGFKQLDPAKIEEVKEKLRSLGVVGPEALAKIQSALNSAVRTESLVQGISAVESAFASLGRGALVAIPAIVKLINDWANSINKLVEEAGRLGQTVQDVDRLHKAFEGAGVSADATSDAIKKISQAGDASQLERVSSALKDIQTLAAQGRASASFGLFNRLTEEANGYGLAADKAREALRQLSLSMDPVGAMALAARANIFRPHIESLQELQAKAGSTKEGLIAFLNELKGISDPTQRTAVAFANLGDAGIKLARSTKTIDEAIAGLNKAPLVTQEQIDAADRLDTSLNKLSGAWTAFKAAIAEPVAIPLIGLLEGVLSAIGGMAGMGANVAREFQQIGQALGYVVEGFNVVIGKIGEFISTIASVTWDSLVTGAVAAWQTIIGWIDKAIAAVGKYLGLQNQKAHDTGSTMPSFARGGMVGGRGSGTSDSNLAWVSRGEHIMPARAVAQPGVLAFLEALRRSGGNLSRVLDGLGRYATGGLVMPTLASAGTGSMSNVTIQFPGLSPIGGLRASSQVVEELQRAAAMAQVRSGGRKPSRYR
jgi:hypothetical protein